MDDKRDELLGAIARGWCHPKNAHKVMDPDLAYAIAEEVRTTMAARDDSIVEEVLDELRRATAKFPTWPTDPLHAVAVLGEEAGELTKAVLQATYEPHKSSPDDVREEALQTAAMALRFLASMPVYRFAPCEQHGQSSAQSQAGEK